MLRYVTGVNECDATMMLQGTEAGFKKYLFTQHLAFYHPYSMFAIISIG